MVMLASDENNTQFVGARNPDDILTVRFFEDAVHNEWESNKQARPVFDNVIMISITTPGSALLNDVHRRKVPSDEVRFKRQWDFFQQTHSNDPEKMGTPLSQWPLLNVAQSAMLKAVGFFTVEHIANASDEQITRIGMHGGMSPYAFRETAQRFLKVARDSSAFNQQAEEIKRRDDEIATLKADGERRDREMEALKQMMLNQTKPERKRPGRKTNAERAAAQAER